MGGGVGSLKTSWHAFAKSKRQPENTPAPSAHHRRSRVHRQHFHRPRKRSPSRRPTPFSGCPKHARLPRAAPTPFPAPKAA
ncbi:hypothetical protein GCWU000324_00331 [Kingella oralis ATCC 51147]|uniref:Uncharacterized protein n=1 Tax=Kingella oralis ATCC 51147 TaxID=629741 RepID=C4GHJ7_9NEIS|nr:hypothetical protein GCWU000324_00331 [Kingella oralis ATCC 51147]